MTLAPAPHLVVVEAPSGPAALALERRLAHLNPVSIAHADHWVVEIPSVDEPAEVETAVRLWLAQIGRPRALVRIDGRVSHVSLGQGSPRHVASHSDFIG